MPLPPTNFRVLSGSFEKPALGDVFEMFIGQKRVLGRVLDDAAAWRDGQTLPAVAVLFFGPVAAGWTLDGRHVLQAKRALLPPFLTDHTAWKRRYFRRVARADFLPGEQPEMLAFKTSNVDRLRGAIVDSRRNVLDGVPEDCPVGTAKGAPQLMIDDLLSDRLGVPRAVSE